MCTASENYPLMKIQKRKLIYCTKYFALLNQVMFILGNMKYFLNVKSLLVLNYTLCRVEFDKV